VPLLPEVEAGEPFEPRTRLIAQNIPWDCTADDMRALFEKHGSVVNVDASMKKEQIFPSLNPQRFFSLLHFDSCPQVPTTPP
jgi:RNA recognition motif-containing protein